MNLLVFFLFIDFDLRLLRAEVELMVIRVIHHVTEPVIEPLIRRVVKEEIELVQEKILTSMKQNSGSAIRPSESRSLQLRFLNKLSVPVLTGNHIEGEDGTSLKLRLYDATGEEVKSGPEASAEVEIVVLREDQNGDEGHDWTQEEFDLKIERERTRNRSLLTGKVFLKLKEGIGLVDKIYFTHTSDWMSKRLFRLGARARIVDNFNGTRVREAKSEPFTLEDCRNNLYKKHYPPSLSDEVWRLKNIGRGGPLVKRLRDENIKTVQQFLKEYFMNPQGLREILGKGMSDKKLDDMVEHGLTCELKDRYVYYNPGSQQKTGVVYNAVRQVVGVLSEYQYIPIHNLSETEKADAQKLVVSAFKQRGEEVPYDENSLLHGSSHSNSPRLQSHSGPDVGTSPIIAGISCNNPIGTSHTIVGYDPMQPSTSSPGILPSNNSIRNSPRIAGYDPTQPSSSFSGVISSTNYIGTSHRIAPYDSTQPSTSSPGILPSNNSIGTSEMTAGYDHTQVGTSSLGIYLSGNSTERISSMDDSGLLDFCGMEFPCEASGALGQVPNHQMFDVMSIIQDFERDFRRRRWLKAHMVLKFSDHVRKKQRVH